MRIFVEAVVGLVLFALLCALMLAVFPHMLPDAVQYRY